MKINRKNKKQKRFFLITNLNVLNVKPGGFFSSIKIKRKIPLKEIEAVTVSRFGLLKLK